MSVVHGLVSCPGTYAHFHAMVSISRLPPRSNMAALILALFGPCSDVAIRLQHISYVGSCVHSILSSTGYNEDAGAVGYLPADLQDVDVESDC